MYANNVSRLNALLAGVFPRASLFFILQQHQQLQQPPPGQTILPVVIHGQYAASGASVSCSLGADVHAGGSRL